VDNFAALRARCLQRTNEFRARASVLALGSRTDQSTCTDAQAGRDAASQKPHGAFGQCGENAQNECPGFKGSPEAVVDRCLQMMFDEGPGQGPEHGHYVNMTNPNYRNLACGFHFMPDGSVWLIQNYYR
jgi:hypothetical protein